MSGPEFSRPAEHERSPPEERLFNVDVMTDDQIIVVARGISMVAETGRQNADDFDPMDTGDYLFTRFARNVRNDLGAHDPERLKNLTQRLTERPVKDSISPDPERHFAALIAPGLIDHDYEFTRDMLTSLTLNEKGTYAYTVEGFVQATAIREIRLLIRDRLTPEQAIDFNYQLASHPQLYYDHAFSPLLPAPPGATIDNYWHAL